MCQRERASGGRVAFAFLPCPTGGGTVLKPREPANTNGENGLRSARASRYTPHPFLQAAVERN